MDRVMAAWPWAFLGGALAAALLLLLLRGLAWLIGELAAPGHNPHCDCGECMRHHMARRMREIRREGLRSWIGLWRR